MGVDMLPDLVGKAVGCVVVVFVVLIVGLGVSVGIIFAQKPDQPRVEDAAMLWADAQNPQRAICRPWVGSDIACRVEIQGHDPVACTCSPRRHGEGYVCRAGVEPLTAP